MDREAFWIDGVILHLDLQRVQGDWVGLRYFTDNSNVFEERQLNISTIQGLIQKAETDYFTRFPVSFPETGKILFDWLDGDERWLTAFLENHRRDITVLALRAAQGLAHLPWEVLHDGQGFLIEKSPAVVPVRWVGNKSQLMWEDQPTNRALNLLFMATAPEGQQSLDFEQEEGKILEATNRQPLNLVVEESGCLEELGYSIEDYGRGFFDVFHLTGHASIHEKPIFLTESATGDTVYATAQDLTQALGHPLPKLLFVSGCQTGKSKVTEDEDGQERLIASLAEELLTLGAGAVLGWGQSVLDPDATLAAGAIYQKLAVGQSVVQGLAFTFQEMLRQKTRDWHLLRFYVADRLPGALVTTPRTQGRKAAPKISEADKFWYLDQSGQQKIKVPTRHEFVGRRRSLQASLRALVAGDKFGVIIHGMGGLGKSSLAARLCDRLSRLQSVVVFGQLDEGRLVKALADLELERELRQTLQDPAEELKYRLRQVFSANLPKDLLVVLDDFEENLDKAQRLKPEAKRVWDSLIWALSHLAEVRGHRLIVTCRYLFGAGQGFVEMPLYGFAGANLVKKRWRLKGMLGLTEVQKGSPLDLLRQQGKDLIRRALALADGNPRLLEWLDQISTDEVLDQELILTRLEGLEQDERELQEKVLAQSLLEQVDGEMAVLLGRAKIYQLPVPRKGILVLVGEAESSLTPLCQAENLIDRAVVLGLLEVSPDGGLRVPRVVPVEVLANEQDVLAKAGAECLYQLWWEDSEGCSEAQALEIHRLAIAGKQAEIAVKIADNITGKWNQTGRFREVLDTCRDTLAIVQNHEILLRLAWAQDDLGLKDESIQNYENALQICPDSDDQNKAAIIHNLAVVYTTQGRVEEAIALYHQSLELQEKIGNVQGKAATLHCMAIIYADQGRVEEAITLYQQSLELTEKIGDVKTKAATLHQMAGIYTDQRRVEEAIALYQQSLELKEKIGDVQGKAVTLHCMAVIYVNQGRIEEAIALYQQSLELKEKIGNVQGKAVTLHCMAVIYADQGRVEEAIALYQQSLETTEKIGYVQGKVITLGMMAQLLAGRRDFDTAIRYFEEAIPILEKIGSPIAQRMKPDLEQVKEMPIFFKILTLFPSTQYLRCPTTMSYDYALRL